MLTVLSLLILSSSALADDTLHPQVNAIVQGTHVVNEAWEIRGSGHFSWAPGPEDDTALCFLYAGPKFHVTPWFAIAPQTGAVVNWNGTGDLLPLVSIWTWVDISPLHFFVEGDVYPDFTSGTVSYYGLYAADYDGLKLVWIGAHAEQVNASMNIGPHIGTPLGKNVWIQVNYHRSLNGGGSNNLRLNVNVSL